jgi:hypothetical protein
LSISGLNVGISSSVERWNTAPDQNDIRNRRRLHMRWRVLSAVPTRAQFAETVRTKSGEPQRQPEQMAASVTAIAL